MRKFIIIIICLLFVKVSYSLNPNELNNKLLLTNNNLSETKIELSSNYQQFKFQLINLESGNYHDFSHYKRRKKNNNLMLYVAGGLAVATATLILTNNPENFTSNSTSGVNLGIAAGGTIACGMIVAKFFIDKSR